MNNLMKYAMIATVALMLPSAVHAEVTVKETTSPEFIRNQGYSSEVSRIIEVKTRDSATPISTEKPSTWKRFGLYLRETIDPAYDKGGKFVDDHDIKYSNTIEDL